MTERFSARRAPGTQREYETILILRPDLLDEAVADFNKKVVDLIDRNNGKLLHVETWGKRRLAYRINKQSKGQYYYWRFLATNPLLDDLYHLSKVAEPVLRQLTVRVDDDVNPETRPADVDPVALNPTLRAKREAEEAAAAAAAKAAAEEAKAAE
ncbi:MAG: 30S ribosomal protein S6, partial [Deltaproteobacteria bacterium]|nr:30S ribosomal protein S6 [Deltaproteobacteria bacterium]